MTIDQKAEIRHTEDTEKLIKKTLENVRLKLLDLSRKNTLLNFRETKRSIRIIDELPTDTYEKVGRFSVKDWSFCLLTHPKRRTKKLNC